MPHRGGYDQGWRYDRNFRYDRGFRQDRGFQGRPRGGYDEGFGRYDRTYQAGPAPREGLGAEFAPPLPFPYVPFGYDPMMGGVAWPGVYAPMPGPRYDRGYHVPPSRSPTFGRGGDRALRAWAERYGYDVEFSIPPRRPRR